MNLRTPGPIPVPTDALAAMSSPMINHRGPEFKDLLHNVTTKLKQVFETDSDIFILSTSGTGALETAIVNTLSPGDVVLSASAGAFGDRFADIAESHGATVIRLKVPWGNAITPNDIELALTNNNAITAVLVTHNETSTGVTIDLEAIAVVVKAFDKLLLVDGVSSVSSIPLRTDAWNCDVVATASQKGWSVPPGLAFVSFSKRAWEAYSNSKMPKYYFDVAAYKKSLETGQSPFTPALSIMFALDIVLDTMLEEGMASVFRRHDCIGSLVRRGIKNLGLSLLADEQFASNTVTAVTVPSGIEASNLINIMRTDQNIVLAGGQQSLSGKIFRIGHMGYCSRAEVEEVLEGLTIVLSQLGFSSKNTND